MMPMTPAKAERVMEMAEADHTMRERAVDDCHMCAGSGEGYRPGRCAATAMERERWI